MVGNGKEESEWRKLRTSGRARARAGAGERVKRPASASVGRRTRTDMPTNSAKTFLEKSPRSEAAVVKLYNDPLSPFLLLLRARCHCRHHSLHILDRVPLKDGNVVLHFGPLRIMLP